MGVLRKFLNLIDLSRPQSVLFVLGSGLFILAVIPYQWLQQGFYHCLWKTTLFPMLFRGHCPATGLLAGCNCPGCGLTRAFWHILHGHPSQAYALNRFSIIAFILVLGLIAFNIFKWQRKKN
jgi:hypothetical protein